MFTLLFVFSFYSISDFFKDHTRWYCTNVVTFCSMLWFLAAYKKTTMIHNFALLATRVFKNAVAASS